MEKRYMPHGTPAKEEKTPIQQAAALMGSKGGQVVTEVKRKALARNASKPRPNRRAQFALAREARAALKNKLQ